jgi:hypothetical protein
MKTQFLALVFLMLQFSFSARGQCGGPITLTTQAEVNAFTTTYPCSEITGDLSISGSDVTNLDSLYRLTKIDGILTIESNDRLTNLDGLSALTSLGISLNGFTSIVIIGNPELVSIKGLKSLTSTPGTLQIENNVSLPNLDGLESLTQIGSLDMRIVSLLINGNTALSNINALSTLHSVGGYYLGLIDIENNPSLTDVNGLSSLRTITGGFNAGLTLINNGSLTNVDGLSSFTKFTASQGIIRIIDNTHLIKGCALFTIINNGNNPGTFVTVVISGNGAGFTEQEILAGGPCPGSTASAQPSNLMVTAVTAHSMNLSFTAAAQAPAGYITLIRAFGSPYPTDEPVDGTVYQVGNVIGSSTIVVSVGNQTSFNVSDLLPNTLYYIDVFSYNSSNHYITVDPLASSQQTANETATQPSDPTVQPSDLQFSNVTNTSMTVSFTVPVKEPTGFVTLMKVLSSPFPQDVPVNGTTYHVGGVIGSSTIVVGLGSSSSLNIEYLIPGTDYYFDVYSYQTLETGGPAYLASIPLEGNQSTLPNSFTSSSHSKPFPNPFTEEITIPFSVKSQNTFVQIVIYNQTGNKIADVASEIFCQGYHELKWDRSDSHGTKVIPGLYMYHIKTDESNHSFSGPLVAK